MQPAVRGPALLLALLIAASGLVALWDLGRRSPGIDFYQFWAIAQVAGRSELGSVYDPGTGARLAAEFRRRAAAGGASPRERAAAELRKAFEPYGSPFLYAVFRPWVSGDYERDLARYRALSLASLALALLGLGRLLGLPGLTTCLFLGLVLHAFQPLRAEVRTGNVNALQLALLAGYLGLASRLDSSRLQLAAGAVLGAALAFKANLLVVPALLAIAWTLDGRWRKLGLQGAGLVLGAGAGIVGGALLFGSLAAWPDWLGFLQTLPAADLPVDRGNFALDRLAREAFGISLVPWAPLAAFGAAAGALAWGRRRAAADETLLVAVGCLVYLLAAPLVWQHYLLLALPAVLYLLRPPAPGAGAGSLRLAVAAVGFTAIAIDPYAELIELRNLTHQALVVCSGVGLLFLATLTELVRGSSRGLAPAPGT